MPIHPRSIWAQSLLTISALAPLATAQIPNNSAIVSRFQPYLTLDQGGLSVVDLNNPGLSTEITGLSTELTGSNLMLDIADGAGCLLFDERTGQIIVGEHTPPGDEIDIHVLTLSGMNVALDERYTLGVVPNGQGWVNQLGWLNGDIVFTVDWEGPATGVMAGHRFGILRTQAGPPGTPGAIVPIPTTTVPTGRLITLTVDERHGFAYFGVDDLNANTNIFRIAVPGDGVTPEPVTYITSIPALALNFAIDTEGQLLVSTWQNPIYRVDITQPTTPVTQVALALNDANGLAIENVTGDAVVAVYDTGEVYRRKNDGTLDLLTTVDGGTSGVAIHQQVGTYGKPTPGQNTYEWELGSSLANAPYLGNTDFAFQMNAEPAAPAASLLALSFGRSSIPAIGLQILVDPLTAVVPSVPAATSSSYALPLPVNPSLIGTLLTAQSVHLEWNFALAASRGLSVTLATMPPPTITSIAPLTPTAGSTVTVSGSNFYGNLTLDVGGIATTVASQSLDSLTFVMPAGAACNSTVTVANGNSTAAAIGFNPSPVILNSSVQGPASGGATFFVTGQNLIGASVTINGTPITVTTQTPGAIVGQSPPGAPGPATVVVTGPSGCTTTVSYTYQ